MYLHVGKDLDSSCTVLWHLVVFTKAAAVSIHCVVSLSFSRPTESTICLFEFLTAEFRDMPATEEHKVSNMTLHSLVHLTICIKSATCRRQHLQEEKENTPHISVGSFSTSLNLVDTN